MDANAKTKPRMPSIQKLTKASPVGVLKTLLYNTVRPHSRIGWLTPAAYAEQLSTQRGQGAALAKGFAPWPLTTDQTEQRQTPVAPG